MKKFLIKTLWFILGNLLVICIFVMAIFFVLWMIAMFIFSIAGIIFISNGTIEPNIWDIISIIIQWWISSWMILDMIRDVIKTPERNIFVYLYKWMKGLYRKDKVYNKVGVIGKF